MFVSRKISILLMVAVLAFASEPAGLVRAQSRNSFVCPMHASVVSSRPGTCPRCGMNLVARAVKPRASSRSRRKRNAVGKEYDPATHIAVPGNTARQRLIQSGRPQASQ